MTIIKHNEWEKRFDDNFYHEDTVDDQPCEYLLNNGDGKCNCQIGEAKSFIKSLLKDEKKKWVEEVIKKVENTKVKTHPCNNCYNPNQMSDKRCINCESARGSNNMADRFLELLQKELK